MMQKDLQADMKDAEADEQAAQKAYEDLMTESAASRAQSAKSITDKEAAKALSVESLEDIQLTVNHLHTSCDFILQNFDTRKEARTNEAESLKNSKAVLQGANFGF